MNYWTDLRVKFIKFFKKHKKKIIIILLIWLLIFSINKYLEYLASLKINIQIPQTTYTPHEPIMDNTENVPEELQEPITNLINEYFNYCNNSEYEKAYNMLSEECKKAYFTNIEIFKKYIDEIFQHQKRIYNIQNFSNVNNTYVYNLNILEDALATGTTGKENFEYYQEKIVIKEENGNLKLSVASYIETQEKQIVAEDEYIKVKILSKQSDYEYETYTVEVTNKTDYTIVLVDNYEAQEVMLKLDNGNNRELKNLQQSNFVLWAGMTDTKELKFKKYYDENRNATELIFNKIRVFEKYTGVNATTQEDLDNAIKLYSLSIGL